MGFAKMPVADEEPSRAFSRGVACLICISDKLH